MMISTSMCAAFPTMPNYCEHNFIITRIIYKQPIFLYMFRPINFRLPLYCFVGVTRRLFRWREKKIDALHA